MDEGPAARIRRLMAERQWSANRLAAECGWKSHSNITNLLARLEVNPTAVELKTLERVGRALGKSGQYLQTGMEPGEVPAPPRELDSPTPHQLDHVDVQRVGQLPNFPAILRATKSQRPQYQPWVWVGFEFAQPMFPGELTVAMAIDMVDAIARHESPPPDGVDPLRFWQTRLRERRELRKAAR